MLGFDFSSLPQGSVIVGTGLAGRYLHDMAGYFPQFKYIYQDDQFINQDASKVNLHIFLYSFTLNNSIDLWQ